MGMNLNLNYPKKTKIYKIIYDRTYKFADGNLSIKWFVSFFLLVWKKEKFCGRFFLDVQVQYQKVIMVEMVSLRFIIAVNGIPFAIAKQKEANKT